LLLSRAIKASKPSRTKEVFSLTPVSRDAFSNILSSMLSVVLICINVHYICIFVNRQNLYASLNIPNNNRGLFRPIIDFEIWNATQFLFIIGNQNAVSRKGMRGDEHVEGTKEVPCFSKRALSLPYGSVK
jgi:hypothetical protein